MGEAQLVVMSAGSSVAWWCGCVRFRVADWVSMVLGFVPKRDDVVIEWRW